MHHLALSKKYILMKLKNTLLLSFLFLGTFFTSKAQSIFAPNLDFEMGTTANWIYYSGTNTTPFMPGSPVWTLVTCAPVPTLHTITNTSMPPDKLALIPVVGDGFYSLKLGKDSAYLNADAASYNIHVPVTGGTFKVTYWYALVMEDPGHPPSMQPRFEINVTDSSSGLSIPCNSYTMIVGAPGFLTSTKTGISYKPWSRGIIDLSGMPGKTVIISFKVGGCTAKGHFGYAYVDMNTGVSGITTPPCHAVTDTLAGPTGDSLYYWTDSATFTATYGTSQTLVIPSPTVTTTYALIATPYAAYGCPDTLFTTIRPGFATNKSHDTTICTGTSISLADVATGIYAPFTYSWSPSTGLSCTTCSTVTATPPAGKTNYLVTVNNSLGCYTTDTIKVYAVSLLSAITGTKSLCTSTTSTLSNSVSGGSWTSSNTVAATIGLSTGVVTPLSAGTSVITYSIGGSCMVTTTVTVHASPGPVVGAAVICTGSAITLSDGIGGGSWTSSNTAIATVGSLTGTVTGLISGTAAITYSIAGCSSLTTVTVCTMPGPITGIPNICSGASTTYTDAVSGGLWTSGNMAVATIGSSTGIATGLSTGSSVITYTIGSCEVYATLSVDPAPVPFTGYSGICTGATATLSDAVSGGSWTSSLTSVAAIGLTSGIVTGISAGTTSITYAIGGCIIYTAVTISTSPGPITGVTGICAGDTKTLSDAVSGGVWGTGSTSIATIGATTGILSGISAGTVFIFYTFGVCSVSTWITVNPLPASSASLSSICSDNDTLSASGGATYSWSPSTGLSCTTCKITTVNPSATTTYTVTGTNSFGCSDIATITVNGDRIFGHITFSGTLPDTLDMNVWLIQFNPTDSSITALDSTMTCVTGGINYYEFDHEPAGYYMVKGMLLFGNPPGASGYVPTYSLSSPHWDSAATVSHSGGSDSMHITMVYGTVPAGPGFIGGYVYSGAGKRTTGDAPVRGILIFLEDAASHVLSHTYTDGTGAYSFSNLALGDYLIYPEDYGYKTTYAAITLNDANISANGVDFRQYLTSKIIIPYTDRTDIKTISSNGDLKIYPNPTSGELNIQWTNQQTRNADLEITDVIGRKLYKSVISMNASSGQVQVNVNGLNEGVYMITIKSDYIYYCGKLMIQK